MSNTEKLGAKKVGNTKESRNFINKTLTFFTKYQNIIYGILIGILVLICAILAFNKFYLQPKNEKAAALIVTPIQYFVQGDSTSLNLALEGDDENDGFLTIASDFKLTKAGNTAKYYAGLCYLKLNDKEEALNYLLQFKKKDDIMWYACQALIGDLYDESGDSGKAMRYYLKAVKGDDPYFTPIALFKLGQLYEREGNLKKALIAYERIEKDFYTEYGRMGVDRYVERAKLNEK
ncbi:MAG: tetratricopeptide repeat protein [Bacteroidales bacterium]